MTVLIELTRCHFTPGHPLAVLSVVRKHVSPNIKQLQV